MLFGSGEQKELLRNMKSLSNDFRKLGEEGHPKAAELSIIEAQRVLKGGVPDDYLNTIDILICGLAALEAKNRRLQEDNEALKLRLVSM